MADEDDGAAEVALDAGQRLHHLALDDDIERGGGFIGDDDLGAQADGNRDAGALLHAAREFVRVEVGDVGGQADGAEELGDTGFEFGAGEFQAVVAEGIRELGLDADDGVKRVHGALRHHGYPGQAQVAHAFVVQRGELGAVEADTAAGDAAGGLDHAQDGQRHGGFAGAGFAGQAQAFAGEEGEGDVVHRLHGAEGVFEFDLEAFDFQDGVHAGPPFGGGAAGTEGRFTTEARRARRRHGGARCNGTLRACSVPSVAPW